MSSILILVASVAKSQIRLANGNSSAYKIVVGAAADAKELKAANILSSYIQKISGATIPVVKDSGKPSETEIRLGRTNRFSPKEKITGDGFLLQSSGQALNIYGASSQSTLYAVYHFLDHYLGCRKYTPDYTFIPKSSEIQLPAINDLQQPQFSFRQVYYPGQYDEEYSNWHKLQLLENEWGLWGHTFARLVPAKTYFKTHPEYFALVEGKRSDAQLCLSNPNTFNILVKNLQGLISEDPDKKLWSVSQNDGFGYCTCAQCRATDNKYGGPQGSVISFVNKVAARFPDKTISTLAYLYSKHPPKDLKPAKNVNIMLSSIDMNRSQSIATDKRANSFRNDIAGWKAITSQLMMWDYVVQFTNYTSPFPNLETLQPNMSFFEKSGIKGLFAQGTEDSPGEFSELKGYLLARLSWNAKTDIGKDKQEFMNAWYGDAAEYMTQYQNLLTQNILNSGKILDIYGDPVSEWNSWLKPEQIDAYSQLLDKAAEAVKNKPEYSRRVAKEYLALDYTVLQQARFYGIDRHGIFDRAGDKWSVRNGIEQKVNRFVESAKRAGIRHLSEGGLSPEQYADEWKDILKKGPLLHAALGKRVTVLSPFNEDFPAKGAETLTDGAPGYNNFQYNYLGWNNSDMEIVIDLGESKKISTVSAGFLEDQRHWAFLPKEVSVEFSDDNLIFTGQVTLKQPIPDEIYTKETHRVKFSLPADLKARYIRLKATKLDKVPEWRKFPNRYAWIFCDEVTVN